MKKIMSLAVITVLGLGFSGCSNQPFNPNIKNVVFANGKAFNAPKGTRYKKNTITQNEAMIYKSHGISNCNKNDLFWISNVKNETIYKPTESAYVSLRVLIYSKRFDNETFASFKNQKKMQSTVDYKILVQNLSTLPDNTTYEMMRNNKNLMRHILFGGEIFFNAKGIHKGTAGCTSEMSKTEFAYENQNRQFKHEKDIQNKRSLDKSMDRMQNQLNHMTPKQHNVDVFVY